MQERADALRPGRFVVLGAFDALIVQAVTELPAFFEEHIAEFLDFLHDARAFARANVQPNARAGLDDGCPGKSMNDVLVPPDGRRERGDFSKDGRMLETYVERNETAQRGTANAGVLRTVDCAVLAIDEGLHFLDEKFCVTVGAAAAELGNGSGRVFANARLGVVHPDDDERSDGARLNAIIRSLADMPVLPGDKGSGAIEKILAVVKIEDGEMTRRLIVVTGRRVNDEIALVAEKARAEFFVFAKLTGTHGAIITRRSFASTCCPEVTRIFTMRPEMGA